METSKCILLCANCHREVHVGLHPSILKLDFSKYRKTHNYKYKTDAKKAAIDYLGGKCIECGYNKHQEILQFHHRDKYNKKFSLYKKLTSMKSFKTCKQELDKCDLLCANCHIKRHTNTYP